MSDTPLLVRFKYYLLRAAEKKIAQAEYSKNYSRYFPLWSDWSQKIADYQTDLAAYEAWRVNFTAAWQAYRERGALAAQCFEAIHENVEKLGHLSLELSDNEHLKSLFREAFGEAAKQNPDLGILRHVVPFRWNREPPNAHQGYAPLTFFELDELDWDKMESFQRGQRYRHVTPLVSHNMPELAYLLDDPRLEAVKDLLPPAPPLAKLAHESRALPKRPARPTPPEGIIFYRPECGSDDTLPPVPPDKVVWR